MRNVGGYSYVVIGDELAATPSRRMDLRQRPRAARTPAGDRFRRLRRAAQGWAAAGRSKPARPWLGIAGLVLIAPFVVLIGAAVARQFTGLVGPYELIATSPVAITVATVSLFLGLPVAFALNVWPVTRLGLRRYTGRLEGLLALEIAPLQLAVVVIAVILAALFLGHLAADSYACLNGVRSAC
jgi:hypothetical protein